MTGDWGEDMRSIRRSILAAAFATALSGGSILLGSGPAMAGGVWAPVPCDGSGACSDGDGQYNGGRYLACDSAKTKTEGLDGIYWQNGPDGARKCFVVR